VYLFLSQKNGQGTLRIFLSTNSLLLFVCDFLPCPGRRLAVFAFVPAQNKMAGVPMNIPIHELSPDFCLRSRGPRFSTASRKRLGRGYICSCPKKLSRVCLNSPFHELSPEVFVSKNEGLSFVRLQPGLADGADKSGEGGVERGGETNS
jgi:hypothetical protein